ncbi:hypothetical protein ABTX85_15625 [Streptomyces sp. NPDC096097]|uniref:hypothetical protein n=1 Tax=Streptomyces sp. NPDC096097 TaxID=3155546 RepID=UPI0033252704
MVCAHRSVADALAAELADTLDIEPADFPRDMPATPLTLYPYALAAFSFRGLLGTPALRAW